MPRGNAKKTARKQRATNGASPQFQLCATLLAHGDLSREQLQEQLADTGATQLHNAMRNAKNLGRIAFIAAKEVYRLTAAGKEWVTGGANLDHQRAIAKKRTPPPKAAKRTKAEKKKSAAAKKTPTARPARAKPPVVPAPPAPATELTLATVVPVTERSFRCGVFSDGGFHLAKAGQAIELTKAECAEMLRYLDRMVAEA